MGSNSMNVQAAYDGATMFEGKAIKVDINDTFQITCNGGKLIIRLKTVGKRLLSARLIFTVLKSQTSVI